MKTPLDPRHRIRQEIIEMLFALSFTKQKISNKKVRDIARNLSKIDKIIEEAAPEFPVAKINKIDLAILRLAVSELLLEKKEPPRVIIDEAIELAKEYGGDTSSSFVNGVLGKIYQEQKIKQWQIKN